MNRKLVPLSLFSLLMLCTLWIATRGEAQMAAAPQPQTLIRPHYNLSAKIDYELLTYTGEARVKIPVRADDPLRDVVFFLYANSMSDTDRPFIVVDEVSLGAAKIPFKLDGAVLRVPLPQAQNVPFELKINYRGVVPRAPEGSGGLMDATGSLGGLGGDIGGMLGGITGETEKPKQPEKKKTVDYGLYSYGQGVLGLGSFWYPSLAVRKDGKWMDDAPDGPGDVGYSDASDFEVMLELPSELKLNIVTPGRDIVGVSLLPGFHYLQADNVRDFAVLISKDFVVKSKEIEAAGKIVTVSSYTLKKHEKKADEVLDIAARAIQSYSKQFGPYPYDSFKVVEGPIRGGAGGMEFSGMTQIASMLYDDWGKQIEGLTASLGLGNLDKLLGADALGEGGGENPAADFAGGMLGQQKDLFDSLLEMTIAHETAHQWWAMAVGSDAQHEPWLDESLTNYSAILYFEDRYGKEKAAQMMELHLKTPYSMGRMMGGGDAPVNLKTAAYANNIQYGAIVYGKGALFYDALRKLVGDEAFFASLREYYARYNGKLAAGDSLQIIMREKSPDKAAPIDALYRRWILEKHGDQDITGGKVADLNDILGGLLGGMDGLMEQ